MDKKSLLAIGLITVMVIVWMVYMSVQEAPPPPPKEKPKQTEQQKDTSTGKPDALAPTADSTAKKTNDSTISIEKFGRSFAKFSHGTEKLVTIENNVIKVQISSKGGVVKNLWLKKYKSWNQYQTQLIWSVFGELGMTFSSRETGQEIDTRQLFFEFDGNVQNNYILKGNDSVGISLKMDLASGRSIIRKYVFYGDKYHFDVDITVNNFEEIFTNKG